LEYSPPPLGPVDAAFRAPVSHAASKLRGWMRWAVLLAGCLLAVPLAIATQLTPSPRGMGTHQQLGLPACSTVQLFGIRCPACGMTTSWAWAVRGRMLRAVRANSGGAVLAMIAAVISPWWIGSGLCGRWLGGVPNEKWILAGAVTVMAVTVIDWMIRIQT